MAGGVGEARDLLEVVVGIKAEDLGEDGAETRVGGGMATVNAAHLTFRDRLSLGGAQLGNPKERQTLANPCPTDRG